MKLFIFDMGSVLVTGLHTLSGIADEIGIDHDAMKEDYWIYDRALMDGWMPEKAYYGHLERKFGKKVEDGAFLRNFTPVPNTRLLGIVRQLKSKGYTLVVGSNTLKEHWDYMLSWEDSPLPLFDRLYASHLIHRSKPDPYFFQYICIEEGVDYKDTAFIDDRLENIETARALGITTFHYTGDGLEEKEREFFKSYL